MKEEVNMYRERKKKENQFERAAGLFSHYKKMLKWSRLPLYTTQKKDDDKVLHSSSVPDYLSGFSGSDY